MRKTFFGNDICDAGQRKIGQKIFTVNTNSLRDKSKCISAFGQAYQVRSFQIRAHHVTELRYCSFFFVVQAYHRKACSGTVSCVMLLDVSVSH